MSSRLKNRLLIGAIAGVAGVIVVRTALRSRQAGEPDPHPEVSLACGAVCGSLIAAADPDAGQASGIMASSGLWLAGQIGAPILVDPESLPRKHRSLTVLAAYLRWGLATVHALRAIRHARDLVREERQKPR